MVLPDPSGKVVIVTMELAPARSLEENAISWLGTALKSTSKAVEQVVAVQLPQELRTVSQSPLEKELKHAEYRYCIFSGTSEAHWRFPRVGWISGGIDDFASCIELAALSEKKIQQGIDALEAGIRETSRRLRSDAADDTPALKEIARILCQRDSEHTTRMAMAIIVNAMTFHHAIAGAHDIKSIDQLRGHDGKIAKPNVLRTWRHILKKINCWPVFKMAHDLVRPIRNGTAAGILDRLANVASDLARLGVESQHDLPGLMFQRLIADRKLLATYYTLPSSAALLADLAVSRLNIDWTDPEAITGLKVADFACGTGALLNAAYTAIRRTYRRSGGDDATIHQRMIEEVLVGSDIMPAATHLTASILSGVHPTIPFHKTSIMTLPYGKPKGELGRGIALGALDFIDGDQTLSIFGTGQPQVLGGASDITKGNQDSAPIPHESFDIVIMNPPFTRPTGHEAEKIGIPVPSFAGFDTSEDEQRHMSTRLATMRKKGSTGHGNAGLASYFIDVAHKKIKRDSGVMAMVLPAAFLIGPSWQAARALLASNYRDIVVVTIANDTKTAFSADTSTAEVLVVASRNRTLGPETDDSCLYVNLDRRPRSILEAMTVSQAIGRRSTQPESPAGNIRIGTENHIGCCIRGKLSEANCAGVRNLDVVQVAKCLNKKELYLPRLSRSVQIPVTALGELGERGLYHMDISGSESRSDHTPRGPFDIHELRDDEIPTYPALWGSWKGKRRKIRAALERQLLVAPGHKGDVRPGCAKRASEAWKKTATRLHFNRDFGLYSQSLAACITESPSIGGRAWPNFICRDKEWEIPLVLWANTTLGLISFWWLGTRQHAGRSMVSITLLPRLDVLDPRCLDDSQLGQAKKIFDRFKRMQLLPANEAYRDNTRQNLDKAVLVDLLSLPAEVIGELNLVRRQWCAEPSVHGGKATAITRQPS